MTDIHKEPRRHTKERHVVIAQIERELKEWILILKRIHQMCDHDEKPKNKFVTIFLFSLSPIMFIWIANTSFSLLLSCWNQVRWCGRQTPWLGIPGKEERIRRNATSRGNMAPYVYVEANGALYSHHQPSGYCAFCSLMNWRCVLTPSTWTHPSKREEFLKEKKRMERKVKKLLHILYRWCSSNRQENITIYIRGDELMMIARLASFVFFTFHRAQRIVPRWPLRVLIELRRTNDRRAGSLRLYWLVLPASRRYTHVDIKVDGCDQVVFFYIEGGSLCRKEKGGG